MVVRDVKPPLNADDARIIVAGHVCLDLIPAFPQLSKVELLPGTLTEIGKTTFATGGVSNTAVALRRMGVPGRFIGKVGDDQFGRMIHDQLQPYQLADELIVAPGDTTSYTYVINPPGMDRLFLHCPGVNDRFAAEDVPFDSLPPARFFHFGYPPHMAEIRANHGAALRTIIEQVKQRGLITSLDLTMPDPSTPAGQMDWISLFKNVGPSVDLFCPSMDELLLMMDRQRYLSLLQQHRQFKVERDLTLCDISGIAKELLAMGMAMVALKLGDQGLYLRTSSSAERLTSVPDSWVGRELLTTCFEADVAGTVGAGDCTIAGFLAAMSGQISCSGGCPQPLFNSLEDRITAPASCGNGCPQPLFGSIEDCLTAAVAVGACCVERPDATSGVRPWNDIAHRITSGWKRHPLRFAHSGWTHNEFRGLWIGPNDRSAC